MYWCYLQLSIYLSPSASPAHASLPTPLTSLYVGGTLPIFATGDFSSCATPRTLISDATWLVYLSIYLSCCLWFVWIPPDTSLLCHWVYYCIYQHWIDSVHLSPNAINVAHTMPLLRSIDGRNALIYLLRRILRRPWECSISMALRCVGVWVAVVVVFVVCLLLLLLRVRYFGFLSGCNYSSVGPGPSLPWCPVHVPSYPGCCSMCPFPLFLSSVSLIWYCVEPTRTISDTRCGVESLQY